MNAPHGYTLSETAVVLLLLAILYGMLVPPVTRWRDRWAARAARDEVAAALAWTRLAAAGHGGATLVLDPERAVLRIQLGDGGTGDSTDLRDRYGVAVEAGGDGSVAVRYDALGIGRFANHTLQFRRGSATAGLVISAHGRVRR